MGFKNQTVAKLLNWAPSKLFDYEACPRRTKHKHIDKLPDPGGPAMVRGTEVHEAAETYVASRGKHALTKELTQHAVIKRLLDTLRKDYKRKRVRLEMELAFNKEWKPVAWLAKDVYCRFKLDVVHFLDGEEVLVIDWKTGKLKDQDAEKYRDQLEMYIIAVLSAGLAKRARAVLAFTDAGAVVEFEEGRSVKLDELPTLRSALDKRVKPMLTDTKFPPRPGSACRYCPYSTNKGGPCQY